MPTERDRRGPDSRPPDSQPANGVNTSNRRNSFFLHLRPATYDAERSGFSTTWFLGAAAVFLVTLELLSGLVLMVYYSPTPETAYESIVRLQSNVPFGWLFRDLHRLGGELMLVVVLLHMARVYLHGRFRQEYGFTWIIGVLLLLCTLLLAFSGYLLPWDQLSYWAVTIGCGLAAAIPVVGDEIANLLKGGAEFGADGLLRFYLLHVLLIPAIMALLLAVHYFRVARVHGQNSKRRQTLGNQDRLPLFPDIVSQELVLALIMLLLLLATATFIYDAPLIQHADPRHTPAGTRAPWFFLWLQGALKFGPSVSMGIYFPLLMSAILILLPLVAGIVPSSRATARFSVIRTLVLILTVAGFTTLSFTGLPGYGITVNPVTTFFEKFCPDEGESSFHDLAFDDFQVGLYSISSTGSPWPAALAGTRKAVQDGVEMLQNTGKYSDCEAVLIIEDWQAGLKRIILRLLYRDKDRKEAHTVDRTIFVHHNNLRK